MKPFLDYQDSRIWWSGGDYMEEDTGTAFVAHPLIHLLSRISLVVTKQSVSRSPVSQLVYAQCTVLNEMLQVQKNTVRSRL